MNKQEFLDALQGGLSGLPKEDLQRILDFYSEIIDDCVEDGLSQEEAVATLGSVDEILASLQTESPHHTASQPQTQTITGPSAVTQVHQPFSSISITASDCTIRLLPATDGVCRVSYHHPAQVGLSITVDQDTLTIRQQDKRSWLERLRGSWGGGEIELYLPGTLYQNLSIHTASGSVEIPNAFTFYHTRLHVVSGSVHCSCGVKERLELKAVSGKLWVEGQNSPDLQLWVKTISGRITLRDILCDSLTVISTSGATDVTALVATSSLCATSVSGKVLLTDCDAGSLELKTVSGKVSSCLRTPKVFSTHTVSGRVSVPTCTEGAPCRITTTSGSITCTIQ